MEMISLEGKTNFFEKKVGEYSKANVGVGKKEEKIFSLNEDF
jgi:ribonucleotide reductase beta subunit family protein with ferritin-like domain